MRVPDVKGSMISGDLGLNDGKEWVVLGLGS